MTRVAIVLLLAWATAGTPGAAADRMGDTFTGVAKAVPDGVQEKGSSTADLIEDLRLLQVLNAAGISREQTRRIEPLAAEAHAKLEQLRGEEQAAVDRLEAAIGTARQRLLQGTATEDPVFEQLRQATAMSEERRKQRTEALLTGVSSRLRSILTLTQVERIKELIAAGAGQPWPPESIRPLARSAAKQDEDIQRLALDLEGLRAASGTSDGERQLQKFLRNLIRDVEPQSREYQSRLSGAQALAQQALSLPPAAFEQRKLQLAATADRLLQSALEADRLTRAYGANSDPYRWFVTEVLFSPRAALVLREKGSPSEP